MMMMTVIFNKICERIIYSNGIRGWGMNVSHIGLSEHTKEEDIS